jgi:hypothetical protein
MFIGKLKQILHCNVFCVDKPCGFTLQRFIIIHSVKDLLVVSVLQSATVSSAELRLQHDTELHLPIYGVKTFVDCILCLFTPVVLFRLPGETCGTGREVQVM